MKLSHIGKGERVVGCLWKLIKWVLYLVVIGCIAAGCYAGNMAYKELFYASWDRILGIENHRTDLKQIQGLEDRYGWQRVTVPSADGTTLRGTYIEDAGNTRKAVILLHGLYQNRSMCVPYIDIYRQMGYNVLLIDLRGHGGSGGERTDWGVHDIEDLDSWVDFLKAKNPAMKIGMHGISLGAAMALLYAGSDQGKDISFYVADSSYGNLMELGRDKLMTYTGDERLVLGMDILNPFFQAALFYHDHKLLCHLDPLYQVKHMTSPVLFLHGGNDTLVPSTVAEELMEASGSSNKSLYIFQGAAHTMEMATNGPAYREHVQNFVRQIP